MTKEKNNSGSEDQSGNRNTSQVQVITRAVNIMRALRDTGGVNLSKLAKEVSLPRSTVHRIVSTLEAENIVSMNSMDGRIHLGLELISLGAAVNNDIRRELHPYLEQLSLEVDETVNLAVLNNDHLIFMDQISRPRRLQAVSDIGIRFPLHCTANGKAMLARLPAEKIEHLVPENLEVYTPNTIQTRAELMEELETVKKTGVGYDAEEYTIGICAVSTVVKLPIDKLASIAIPIPSVRYYGDEDRFVSALIQTAHIINSRFGS